MAAKAKKAAKRRGRPPGTGTGRNGRGIELYLPQTVIDRAKQIGDGNASLGVTRAVESHKERT